MSNRVCLPRVTFYLNHNIAQGQNAVNETAGGCYKITDINILNLFYKNMLYNKFRR